MHVVNFYILYVKYYIYIQCLYNNKLHAVTQLKQSVKIEEHICIKIMKKSSSNSTLSMRNYKTTLKLMQ